MSDYYGECDRCHYERPLWIDTESDEPDAEWAYCGDCWNALGLDVRLIEDRAE